MRKKMLMFCVALAAIATSFIGCTSEEDLTPLKDTTSTDTGIPFTINASIENASGTRAVDVNKTSNPLVNFQLYAVNNTSNWIQGITFTKSGSWTGDWGKDEQPNWPNGTSTFYGISNNTETAPVFTGTITNGSFTYDLPTSVSAQEDLLAGTTTGTAATGANISFKHILGAVTGLNFKLNALLSGTADGDQAYYLIVKEVSFCNLITKGTYVYETGMWDTQSLANDAAWEANDDKVDITINGAGLTGKSTAADILQDLTFTFDVPDDCPETVPDDLSDYVQADYTANWSVNLANNIYLLPQSHIVKWAPGTPAGLVYPNDPTEQDGAYLKIKCVFGLCEDLTEDITDDSFFVPNVSNNDPADISEAKEDDGDYIYVPFNAVEILPNNGYTLNINILKAYTISSQGLTLVIPTAKMEA